MFNYSRSIKCNICDSTMEQIKVNEWLCHECGNKAFLEDTEDFGTLYFEHDPNDDYAAHYDESVYKKNVVGFDQDDIPEGCLACGSDMYPICKEGCKLIDD